jgi:TIR domain
MSDPAGIAVFLSHANEDAELVSQTAHALQALGLKAFVAAHHIAPTDEWLPQLEDELLRAEVLAAFLSAAFRKSEWTDQEVGYALGQRRKIIPVQLDKASVPHGFLNRYQSLPAFDMAADDIAASIFDLLLDHAQTQPPLRRIVCDRLKTDRDDTRLKAWVGKVARFKRLSRDEVTALRHALQTNPVLRNDFSLARVLQDIIDRKYGNEGSEEP